LDILVGEIFVIESVGYCWPRSVRCDGGAVESVRRNGRARHILANFVAIIIITKLVVISKQRNKRLFVIVVHWL
jgi:hypothetical protein